MSRIRPVPRDEAPPDVQRLYDAQVERFGFVLNPTQVWAHRPSILLASQRLYRAVEADGVLSPALRALICVRVATAVGCPF